MARLFQSGAEMQTVSDGFEFTSSSGTAPTISTSTFRSGSASFRFNPSASTSFANVSFRSSATSIVYARAYVKVATLPGAPGTTILTLCNSVGSSIGNIALVNDGTLVLLNGSGTQRGSASSSIDDGNWHLIELSADDASANNTITARLDGSEFATGDGTNLASTTNLRWGSIDSETCDLYFDDLAVNDANGSSQTSWPGSGKLVLALPTGAGDNAATTGVFSYINEIPPSDTATSGSTMVELDTNTTIAEYNATDSSTLGINSGDTINVVEVIGRIREESTGASNYTFRIKSASGGTVSSSASVDAGTTIVRTSPNGTTDFGNRHFTYTDPTTGVAWTPTGTNSIDNMQIGVATTDGNPDIWVLWLGAYIDYTPSTATTSTSTTSTSSSTSTSTTSTSRTTSTSTTSTSSSTSTTSTSSSTSTTSTSSSTSTTSTSSSTSTSTTSTSSSTSTSTTSTSSSTSTTSTSSSTSTSTTSTSTSTTSTSSSTSTSTTSTSSSTSSSTSTTSTSSSTSTTTSTTSTSSSTSTTSTSSSTSTSTTSTSSSTSTTSTSSSTSTSTTSTSSSTSTTTSTSTTSTSSSTSTSTTSTSSSTSTSTTSTSSSTSQTTSTSTTVSLTTSTSTTSTSSSTSTSTTSTSSSTSTSTTSTSSSTSTSTTSTSSSTSTSTTSTSSSTSTSTSTTSTSSSTSTSLTTSTSTTNSLTTSTSTTSTSTTSTSSSTSRTTSTSSSTSISTSSSTTQTVPYNFEVERHPQRGLVKNDESYTMVVEKIPQYNLKKESYIPIPEVEQLEK